ncbi:MAG: phosphatidylinositol dimannoside acyltransferase [Thermoanaerobaculia bacterium]|nr:phosphatidylinositol dimannoside acyltransferase [Thermoanaerobaculia bacterium]
MTRPAWWQRFRARGVFWRQLLRFATLNVPPWTEPVIIAFWSAFFLFWGPARRGLMRNLVVIKPRSLAIVNFFRCYRVFWNFAWTIADNIRFKESRSIPDWEFTGWKYFQEMQSREGAILLTAHMGSYDLGAQLFSETSTRRIVMVRAPEGDSETQEFEEGHAAGGLRIEFNTRASDLAIDLLSVIRDGSIVAIQGDRVTGDIAFLPATVFGQPTRVPAGPFALALAARVPIYPVFVVRLGRRRYRLMTSRPIELVRSRNRDADFARAVEQWVEELERAIAEGWFQWFTFDPYWPEIAA